MDKEQKELLMNLQVATITLGILDKRRLGLQARFEGLTAQFNHEKIERNAENLSRFNAEIDEILEKGKALLSEYDEFSEWTKANLPEEHWFPRKR